MKPAVIALALLLFGGSAAARQRVVCEDGGNLVCRRGAVCILEHATSTRYDLTQHQKVSGAKLEYFDQERNERYLPHVIEPAAGLTRGLLAVLCEAYSVDESRPSPELMRFHPRLAPIKAGVFPLVNKDGMPEVAERIYRDLRAAVGPCQFDAKQSIGKRYARMDEAGTPFCITVDGQTLTDQTVTVRDRDTGGQVRVSADQVTAYVSERVR